MEPKRSRCCQADVPKCDEPDGEKPCQRCINQSILESGKKLWNLECFRGRITDIDAYRYSMFKFTK